MSSAWIGAVAAVLGVPLVFFVLRRFYPAQPAPTSSRTLQDLRAEYSRWELLTLVLYLCLVAPISIYFCWLLFLGMAGGAGFVETKEGLLLRPSPIAWFLPAMFLGLALSGPLVDFALRRMLRDRHPEYLAYQNRRFGVDFQRFLMPLHSVVAGLSVLLALLLANSYVHVAPAQIRINPFFGISEHVYSYSEVSGIRTAPAFVAPNGKRVDRRLFIVGFSDSRTWNTSNSPSQASESEFLTLIRVISERSGKPISEVALFTREDL